LCPSQWIFRPSAAQETYNEVKARGLVVSILINDAGQGQWGEFAETPLQRDLDIIQLNVASLVRMTKLFAGYD
jgi:short-subunit dehydrogenase